MKLDYYPTSDPDILSIAEEVENDLFTSLQYFETLNM